MSAVDPPTLPIRGSGGPPRPKPNVFTTVDGCVSATIDDLRRDRTLLDASLDLRLMVSERTSPEDVDFLLGLVGADVPNVREISITTSLPSFFDATRLGEFCPGIEAFVKGLERILGGQPKLRAFECSSVPLGHVPDALRGATGLVELRLEHADIKVLPEWVFTLSSLVNLSLGNNKISDLPSLAAESSPLHRLDLSYNPLMSVPSGIWNLSTLEELDLEGCYVTEIPADILRLRLLRNLSIHVNELTTPPPEVARQGVAAIKSYWRQQRDSGVDYLAEAKLLIVGEPGAGKTSLAKKIIDPRYRLVTDEHSTQGIDVLTWNFPTIIRNDDTDVVLNRDYRVNIWDFGGQEIYHATHQFFLTKRSTYVLVVDDRKEDTDLEYWLEVVNLLSDGSPLIIIQNCRQGRRRALDQRALQQRYPKLCGSYSLDLADNTGLRDAVERIKGELDRLPHIGTPLPKTWREVRLALEVDERNYISADEFFKICRANGFEHRADMLQLGGFLHDLGICLFFQEDPLLNKTVILKPEWGTRAVYRVLDDPQIVDDYGVFNSADLERIWPEPTYFEMRGELLRLMTKFELCYPSPQPGVYVAPQLLTPTQPDYHWDDSGNLRVRYVYDVMPKGIVRRVIVALHDLIEPGHVWRTGAVFTANGSRAEVVEEHYRRRLLVRVSGVDPRIILDRIDRALEIIHRSFLELKLQRYRPCDCLSCVVAVEPTMFSIDTLRRFAETDSPIQCQLSTQLMDAAQLLADLTPPAPRSRYVAEPQVFVSYKRDGAGEELVDQIVVGLRSRGVTVIRDRDDLAYRDSISSFMRELGDSSAVVLVLDKEYLESPYCMFELCEIAKHSNFNTRIFPILLPDLKIADPHERLAYVAHWERKAEKLSEAMSEVRPENLQGIRDDLDLYLQIRNTVGSITDVLRDMHMISPDEIDILYRAVQRPDAEQTWFMPPDERR